MKTPATAIIRNAAGLITQIETPENTVRLGQFYQPFGGFLLGVMPGRSDATPSRPLVEPYGLILLPGEGVDLAWGPYGHNVAGADDDNDGLLNTENILKQTVAHPAAAWAREQGPDAYLPARNELRLAYVTAPHLFAKVWHHSSTQYSPDNAFSQNFSDGYQDFYVKLLKARVRAVRRVTLVIR